MSLTARGSPDGDGINGVLAFFDRGHEAAAHALVALTTEHMHEVWGMTWMTTAGRAAVGEGEVALSRRDWRPIEDPSVVAIQDRPTAASMWHEALSSILKLAEGIPNRRHRPDHRTRRPGARLASYHGAAS